MIKMKQRTICTIGVIVLAIMALNSSGQKEWWWGGYNPPVQESGNWVYQEDADSYKCEGIFDGGHPCQSAYDGDWDTFASSPWTPFTEGYIYIDYLKPANALGNSILMISDGTKKNVTISQSCSDYGDTVSFKLVLDGASDTSTLSCYDGTWVDLYRGDISIYEEAMWWHIEEPIDKIIFRYGNKEITLEENQYVDIEGNEVTFTNAWSIRQLINNLTRLLYRR